MSEHHNQENEVVEELIQEEQDAVAPEPILIGTFLKQERESRNLSIKLISQHTKISSSLLEKLEENDFESLPNKAYVIGFVKSYSKTLSLDEKECLDILELSYHIIDKENNPLISIREKKSIEVKKPSKNTAKADNSKGEISPLALIVGGLSVCAIIVGVAYSVRSDKVAETKKEIIQTQELSESTPLKQEIVKTAPQSEVKTESKGNAEVIATAQVEDKKEAIVKVENKKEAVVKVEEKKEEIKPIEAKKEKVEAAKEYTFKPLPQPLYLVDSKTPKEELTKLIPSNFRNSTINGKENVLISAVRNDTWITYKSDDKPIKKFILKKGKNLLIRGEKIRLFLGNAKAANIFRNEKLLTIKTSSGVKSLVFPQEEAKEFSLPLFIYKKDGSVITSKEYIDSKE